MQWVRMYRPTTAPHFPHPPWPDAVIADKRRFQLPLSHYNPIHLRPLPSAPYPATQNHHITSTGVSHPGTAPLPYPTWPAVINTIKSEQPLEHSRQCFNPTATAPDAFNKIFSPNLTVSLLFFHLQISFSTNIENNLIEKYPTNAVAAIIDAIITVLDGEDQRQYLVGGRCCRPIISTYHKVSLQTSTLNTFFH